MKTIAIRQAATLLYLKHRETGVVPELTSFLAHLGVTSSVSYMALLLRGLEAQGWVELIGRRRRFRFGAEVNEWRLTSEGHQEAAAIECCFQGLLTPPVELIGQAGAGGRSGRKAWWARAGRNRVIQRSSRAGRSSHR